jgi:hypothetical protein
VLLVAQGHTQEMHSAREPVLRHFHWRLDLLNRTVKLARWLEEIGAKDVAGADGLLPEIAELESLEERVFDHWRTAENLEALAVREFPLSNEELDQAAAHHRPPASWYEEEGKPF